MKNAGDYYSPAFFVEKCLVFLGYTMYIYVNNSFVVFFVLKSMLLLPVLNGFGIFYIFLELLLVDKVVECVNK